MRDKFFWKCLIESQSVLKLYFMVKFVWCMIVDAWLFISFVVLCWDLPCLASYSSFLCWHILLHNRGRWLWNSQVQKPFYLFLYWFMLKAYLVSNWPKLGFKCVLDYHWFMLRTYLASNWPKFGSKCNSLYLSWEMFAHVISYSYLDLGFLD